MALILTGKTHTQTALDHGNSDTAPSQGPQGGPLGPTFGFDVKVPPHERVAMVGQRRAKPTRLRATYELPTITSPPTGTKPDLIKRGE